MLNYPSGVSSFGIAIPDTATAPFKTPAKFGLDVFSSDERAFPKLLER